MEFHFMDDRWSSDKNTMKLFLCLPRYYLSLCPINSRNLSLKILSFASLTQRNFKSCFVPPCLLLLRKLPPDRTDAKAETPVLWPPHAKSWLIGKDPDAGRDWGQEEKGTTGWDGWMASPTLWTWVWVNSGSWWWTGRPGVLRFMGSQRVRHDWATELNWTDSALSKLWETVKDREACCAAVYRVINSWAPLSDWTTILPTSSD